MGQGSMVVLPFTAVDKLKFYLMFFPFRMKKPKMKLKV